MLKVFIVPKALVHLRQNIYSNLKAIFQVSKCFMLYKL